MEMRSVEAIRGCWRPYMPTPMPKLSKLQLFHVSRGAFFDVSFPPWAPPEFVEYALLFFFWLSSPFL